MLVALAAWSVCALAAPRAAAIEIDARAEAQLDPRAVRRLVQLELADVVVRPAPGQKETALFVRVLGAGEDGQLTVELWEHGIAHGSRVVAGAMGATQLVARRVALAAAELARELRDERDDAAAAAEEQRLRALDAARVARDSTRNGPRALRAGFFGSWARELGLVGPELSAELDLQRAVRLDLGAAWLTGAIDARHAAQSYTFELGPARRFVLARGWDLDAGVNAEASILNFPDVYAVDGMPGQHQTWSARVTARLRLEPRLSRSVRLALGVGAGTTLRSVPLELEPGDTRRLGGPFVSGELALVLTPL